jgi:hypothetical protein
MIPAPSTMIVCLGPSSILLPASPSRSIRRHPFDHVEELDFRIVFVPVIRTFHDAQANDRVIYLAKRLIEPWMRAAVDERLDIDHFERREVDVQVRVVRVFVCLWRDLRRLLHDR